MPEPEVVAVPSVSQLVDVRSRRYVIRRSALGASPAYEAPVQDEHLVTLSSVDDEGAGQALEVVWEIEPGARAFGQGALPEPTSFDEPAVFDAFLDAVRWGAISSADRRSLQAPFRSGIELEAKIPVRKALLYYALKRLGLDTDPAARRPQDQQIVLLNAAELGPRTPAQSSTLRMDG